MIWNFHGRRLGWVHIQAGRGFSKSPAGQLSVRRGEESLPDAILLHDCKRKNPPTTVAGR